MIQNTTVWTPVYHRVLPSIVTGSHVLAEWTGTKGNEEICSSIQSVILFENQNPNLKVTSPTTCLSGHASC